MASILRQIVASPRTRHPEAGLDLSYITEDIIATSGPSQTYPQRAYRNPLDQLVAFLDAKHGDNWAIWEFRAEGTGYPDDLVYGRIRHYPWPDHHPPPFRLIPMIMASMRNWLHGGDLEGGRVTEAGQPTSTSETQPGVSKPTSGEAKEDSRKKRVVVVHCKAGKGRSGTISCSYLISEQGWKAEDALARFTERRMRPNFGAGVSIPSQLRWVSYVDRWTRGGKRYLDRPVEIVEIHVWGLRNGVKVTVEGFANEGKKIDVLHTFRKHERLIVEGDAPESGGIGEMVWDMAGYKLDKKETAPEEADMADSTNNGNEPKKGSSGSLGTGGKMLKKGTKLIRKVSTIRPSSPPEPEPAAGNINTPSSLSSTATSDTTTDADPGGMAVILKPSSPIAIAGSDVCLSVELRNRAHKSIGLTMVSAVAHVWFNTFFEGQGPEQGGTPSDNGVFTIDWEAMDGIKGSSRKGARALDRVTVVWRAAGSQDQQVVVDEPDEGQAVPQVAPADWKGADAEAPGVDRDLGLRVKSPTSADVSKASSLKSAEAAPALKTGDDKVEVGSLEGVKSSGPSGEELVSADGQPRTGLTEGS
ncbi:hypothetical protein S7711_02735 [Stachybotrys chartarum IBT 7711]|uniref:phosphatidylinositol-3,4,5-trisphosphate 3-phosphatase n=1 Tax=Stachybotrys chartarum (strain CBS 109288 / IBT 7711) TaxID=1280523 RepID=A0A084ALU0_STACB|nr:hypothetical protein S7711_02735 [Stachybotrys chartarum IBT 7711]